MNVGSLFAGIGGFDLGFERAGMSVEWQVEQDPYCRAVLARHFPKASRFERVEEVGAANLAPVDLVCGGFPCQDLSAAGRGAGLDGARSGLWSEFARIVRELRPGYVVVENVPALLTGKGKRWKRAPIGRVLGDLAEVGYDAEWACLSAREFGAPHLRKRVWIVAYPARDAEAGPAPEPGSKRQRARPGGPARREGTRPDTDPRRLTLVSQFDRTAQARRQAPPRGQHPHRLRHPLSDSDRDGCSQGLRVSAGARQRPGSANALGCRSGDVSGPVGGGCQGRSRLDRRGEAGESHWAVEPGVGRVADGVPDRVDRLAALGNALVPQIAAWIGHRILAFEEASAAAAAPAAKEAMS